MTFSGTLTMRQRHSPTNREEGGVGGDGKGLAAVKGKGEREGRQEGGKNGRPPLLLLAARIAARRQHCPAAAATVSVELIKIIILSSLETSRPQPCSKRVRAAPA